MTIGIKAEDMNMLNASNTKRHLKSYCHRFYVIEKYEDSEVCLKPIEYMPYDLSEVAMMQYMNKTYDNSNHDYRLVHVVCSEISYEIEEESLWKKIKLL